MSTSQVPTSVFGWYDDRTRNIALLTPWSMVHLAMGVLAAAVARLLCPRRSLGDMLAVWAGVHLVYESKDVYISYFSNGHRNSFANSVADQAVAMVAFVGAWHLGVGLPLSIAVAVITLFVLTSSITSPKGEPTTIAGSWSSRG